MRRLRYLVGIGSALAIATFAASMAHAAGLADAPRQAVITVKGLACPFCVYGLEKHLRKLPGATRVQVDLGKGKATVDFAADSKVSDEDIRKAVKNAGFTADRIDWQVAATGSDKAEMRAEFAIEGMRCEYCVANIAARLRKLPGVMSAQVDLANGSASVGYDPARTSPKDIIAAIEQAGQFRAALKTAPGAEPKR